MAKRLESHEIKEMKLTMYMKLTCLAHNSVDRRIKVLNIKKVYDSDPGRGRPYVVLSSKDVIKLENYDNIEFRGLKTLDEISKILEIKKSEVQGRAKRYDLKASKINRVLYYSRDQVKILVKNKESIVSFFPKIKVKSKHIKNNRELGLHHRLQDNYFFEPEYMRI